MARRRSSTRLAAARGLRVLRAASWPAALAAPAVAVRWRRRHRRSEAVRQWRPGAGRQRRAGSLSARTLGDARRVVILLHGLAASGDYFGAGYDGLAEDAQLVICDLRGFGRSLETGAGEHSLRAHLVALDDMARELGLDGRPLTVAGHSLGALLAVHWAARRTDVERVVCFSAPLYRDPGEADERVQAMGRVERLFATQGPVPHALCWWMSRCRPLAQWVAVALEPGLPVAVTRMAVRHTWASYTAAMNDVIGCGGWAGPLAALEQAGTPVVLADGARDPVPVPGRAAELAALHANIALATHGGAGHQLPITHASWCADLLDQAQWSATVAPSGIIGRRWSSHSWIPPAIE
jgi:pimeloyl-ACP methyl ester carboxylesterase